MIVKNGTTLFTTSSSEDSRKQVGKLAAQFENTQNFGHDVRQEDYTINEWSALLLRYLTLLPDPIIPDEYYYRLRDTLYDIDINLQDLASLHVYEVAQDNRKYCSQTLAKIAQPNRDVLYYVLSLLYFVAVKENRKYPTCAAISELFYSSILRPPKNAFQMGPDASIQDKAVVACLIANATLWPQYELQRRSLAATGREA